MKAMILAAGRGERLKPLTDETPKPLIKVAGKSLIEYHLKNLANAGFKEVIINTAWLAEKIHQQLGNGEKYGIPITYSDEGEEDNNQALETAGGIINALPLLGDQPFLVVNGDIWCDFDFSNIPKLTGNTQAHLILVENPKHNSNGDFSLQHDPLQHTSLQHDSIQHDPIQNSLIKNSGAIMNTYSGIAIFSPDFFAQQQPGYQALAPILRNKCKDNLVSGQLYEGLWTDVGTLERLQQLENQLSSGVV